ncbi:hypothetical protein BB560_004087, partial [Smittium megazygosporum]
MDSEVIYVLVLENISSSESEMSEDDFNPADKLFLSVERGYRDIEVSYIPELNAEIAEKNTPEYRHNSPWNTSRYIFGFAFVIPTTSAPWNNDLETMKTLRKPRKPCKRG